MAAGIAGRGRHQSSTAPVLIAVALLTVFVVGVVQGRSPCSSTGAFGRGQVMALGIGGAEAVGNYGEMMQLRRCSHQLHLRGGDDEDEGEAADEAEGGAEEGDGEGEKEEDSDAGPMTLTKAIKQVRGDFSLWGPCLRVYDSMCCSRSVLLCELRPEQQLKDFDAVCVRCFTTRESITV